MFVGCMLFLSISLHRSRTRLFMFRWSPDWSLIDLVDRNFMRDTICTLKRLSPVLPQCDLDRSINGKSASCAAMYRFSERESCN